MLESDAKTKTCHLTLNGVRNTCLGSACMAWQESLYREPIFKEGEATLDYEAMNKVGSIPHDPPQGECGVGFYPEIYCNAPG